MNGSLMVALGMVLALVVYYVCLVITFCLIWAGALPLLDGFYMIDNTIDIRELRTYGGFTTDTNEQSGVSCFLGNHPLSYFIWNIATN